MPKVPSYTQKQIQSHPVVIFKEPMTESLSVSYPSVARIVRKIKLTGYTDDHSCETRTVEKVPNSKGDKVRGNCRLLT